MAKIFLLDRYDSSLKLQGEKIVSLSPSVSYQLSKAGIGYLVFEDYCSEEKLKKIEKKYFFEQLEWFNSFDDFINKNVEISRRFNIPLASSNYYRIKQFIDTVVIYSIYINELLEKEKDIKELVYVYEPFFKNGETPVAEFIRKTREVFRDLLKSFCDKSGVNYSENVIRSAEGFEDCSKPLKKEMFGLRPFLKCLYCLYKYRKILKVFKYNGCFDGLGVFFAHAGAMDMDLPLKMLIYEGVRVFLKDKYKIHREDGFLRKAVRSPDIDINLLADLKSQCHDCAVKLMQNNEIFSWVTERCKTDVSSVIYPFLRSFVSEECSSILQGSLEACKFYQEHDIDFVFARGNTDTESLSYIIAAKYMSKTKSICIQHASFALNNEALAVMDMGTYDSVIARDTIGRGFYEKAGKTICDCGCRVYESAHYISSIRRGKLRKKRRPNVVYVEKKFPDRIRCLNDWVYPMNWYFKYLRRVIDFFGSEKDFDFIYKHSPGQRWADNSILKYIGDKNYKNVSVESKPFIKTLKCADKVIVDYPSGAFFEAVHSGKSVLCLYADYFKIIDGAKLVFGKSLQPFSSVEDAISLIMQFLYAGNTEYVGDVPFSKEGFVDVFGRLIKDFDL